MEGRELELKVTSATAMNAAYRTSSLKLKIDPSCSVSGAFEPYCGQLFCLVQTQATARSLCTDASFML